MREPWVPKACSFWRHRKVLAHSAVKPGAGIFVGVLFDAALAANYLGDRKGLLAPEESTVAFLGADLRAHGLTPRQVAAAFYACIEHKLLAREGNRLRIVGEEDWRLPRSSTERSRAHRDRERERNGPATPVQRDATPTQRAGNENATRKQRECNGGTGTSTDPHPSIGSTEGPRARVVAAAPAMDGWMDGERKHSEDLTLVGASAIDAELKRLAMWDVAPDKRAHVAAELALAGVKVGQLDALHALAESESDTPHALLATWLQDADLRAAALTRAEKRGAAEPEVPRSTELTAEQREAERQRWAKPDAAPALSFKDGLAAARREAEAKATPVDERRAQ